MLSAEKSIGEGSFHSAIVPYRTQDHVFRPRPAWSHAHPITHNSLFEEIVL
jgi:hypothetical protein